MMRQNPETDTWKSSLGRMKLRERSLSLSAELREPYTIGHSF